MTKKIKEKKKKRGGVSGKEIPHHKSVSPWIADVPQCLYTSVLGTVKDTTLLSPQWTGVSLTHESVRLKQSSTHSVREQKKVCVCGGG